MKHLNYLWLYEDERCELCVSRLGPPDRRLAKNIIRVIDAQLFDVVSAQLRDLELWANQVIAHTEETNKLVERYRAKLEEY